MLARGLLLWSLSAAHGTLRGFHSMGAAAMLRILCVPTLALVALAGCKPIGVLTGPLEQQLVYQPSGPAKANFETPNLAREDVYFTSADGVKLHGWYCPAKTPRGVVLFAHGNGGNLSSRWERYRLLANRLELTVLAFDYRGYGQSEGKPSEAGVMADARAARAFLATKAHVAESEIILYGQSLGGAVMVELAATDGAKALILESTFTSLADVANFKFPLTPPGKILRNEFNSLAKIDQYRGPLLIVHGDADRIVPIEQAQRLYAAANEPKSFVKVEKGPHNWKPTLDVILGIDQFLRNLPSSQAKDSREAAAGVNS
jgi:fermentation-respiration switch protein FrsA (DUF1100 family)